MKNTKTSNKDFIYSFNITAFMATWLFKRILLNIFFGLFNMIVLTYATISIVGSGWELIWVIGILIYAACYWIITSILFDAMIGDEIDNNMD